MWFISLYLWLNTANLNIDLFSASQNIHSIFQLLQLATVISSLQFHLCLAHRRRKGPQPCYPSVWTQTANPESMSSRVYLSTSPLRLSARFASLWQNPWWVHTEDLCPFQSFLMSNIDFTAPRRDEGWMVFPLVCFLTSCVCVCVCVCTQSHLTLCNPMDCNPPGSSVHGIFQARMLEQVTILSARGSSWPRDQTCLLYQ